MSDGQYVSLNSTKQFLYLNKNLTTLLVDKRQRCSDCLVEYDWRVDEVASLTNFFWTTGLRCKMWGSALQQWKTSLYFY